MTDTGSESDDSMSSSSGSSSGSSSDSDSETDYSIGKPEPEDECWNGEEDSDMPLSLCLFCKEKFELNSLNSHMKTAHGFDLDSLRQKFSMDQLSFIKLVNFTRLEVRKAVEGVEVQKELDAVVKKLSTCTDPVWECDKYLQPVIEDDPLLSYWFDDFDSIVLENVNVCEGSIENKVEDFTKAENSELKAKIVDYERALDEACGRISLMKEIMNRIMGDEAGISKHNILKRYTESLSKNNQEYFESYDDSHIHAVMLNDRQRTEAYRDAILNNAVDFSGKFVLDVGCGTGILSMFAAQAGASKVFAVDRSKIIEKAIEIVRENGFSERIECIQGTVESINLPVEKVDIIISEFMGYFLLFEGMLSSYIDARKKYLRPGGAMYPNTAEIFIVGIDDKAKSEEQEKMWDDVYGFKMSVMKRKRKLSPIVETVAEDRCITSTAKVLSLDLVTCEYRDASFQSNFEVMSMRDGHITGVTGYFDTGFTQGSKFKNVLSTAPNLPETHWYQTTFPLETPLQVKKGDLVKGVFECRPNLKNARSLDVVITIGEDKCTYLLD